MTRIVEKPDTPISKLANIGLYYIKDWKTLFDGITEVMRGPAGKGGEYYLTDAFQYMVDCGKKLIVGEVTGWYDCGKVDTLLETNRHLLEHGRARRPQTVPKGVTIKDPVYIEDGVRLADCAIGPNVSVGAGSSVTGSTVANSILGDSVRIQGATVEDSLVGDDQVIEGRSVQRSVLDGGERAAAR
jgi:glucose-1-phosphate thymidylyltransferase